MPGTVILGCQFGDEGKGKVIDYLAESADLVVRFNGGANAGHTVLVGEEKYAFHLVPSGILRPSTMNVLGNGVVVEPAVLLEELEGLRARGHPAENLRISDRAHVVMPYHKVQDRVEEDLKGRMKAGTTGRGIGPVYEDKVGRFGIRMADLLDPAVLQDKLETLVPIKQRLLQAYGSHEVLDGKALVREYAGYGDKLAKYVVDTSILLDREVRAGKRILFEGAHGTLLDVDFGVYPYGVSWLTGLAITKLDVLGGLKTVKACVAYTFADERITEFPADMRVLSKVRPVYEEHAGWPALEEKEWPRLARKGLDALPETLRAYVDVISREMRAPLRLVSLGRSREGTIFLTPWG